MTPQELQAAIRVAHVEHLIAMLDLRKVNERVQKTDEALEALLSQIGNASTNEGGMTP